MRIEIEKEKQGDRDACGDAVWSAYIRSDSLLTSGHARDLARMFVHFFEDNEEPHWSSPRLREIEAVGETDRGRARNWYVKITVCKTG